MRSTRNFLLQFALVVAFIAVPLLTYSPPVETSRVSETSAVKNLHLANARPVLGLSRPVKPSSKVSLA